jgi:hypothetical protein
MSTRFATATLAPPVLIVAQPAVVNLALYAGDDFYLDVTVTNPNGSAADLSSAVAQAQIRTAPEDDPPIAVFAVTITANVIHLHLTHAASTGLVSGVWDCQIATPDVTTLAAGTVIVTPEVTYP